MVGKQEVPFLTSAACHPTLEVAPLCDPEGPRTAVLARRHTRSSRSSFLRLACAVVSGWMRPLTPSFPLHVLHAAPCPTQTETKVTEALRTCCLCPPLGVLLLVSSSLCSFSLLRSPPGFESLASLLSLLLLLLLLHRLLSSSPRDASPPHLPPPQMNHNFKLTRRRRKAKRRRRRRLPAPRVKCELGEDVWLRDRALIGRPSPGKDQRA